MRALTWEIAFQYRDPEDYGIPQAPISVDEDGEPWLECDSPVKVRR